MTECAEGALQIIDGKAQVVSDRYCDGLGTRIGECPAGALQIIEREAEPFDEKAVARHIAEKSSSVMPCGCPSSHIQIFETGSSRERPEQSSDIGSEEESSLTHWPVQIRFVPASDPFLKKRTFLSSQIVRLSPFLHFIVI